MEGVGGEKLPLKGHNESASRRDLYLRPETVIDKLCGLGPQASLPL